MKLKPSGFDVRMIGWFRIRAMKEGTNVIACCDYMASFNGKRFPKTCGAIG